MKFTFNMLLGHIGASAKVIAAHKSVSERGFSKIRVVVGEMASFDGCEDTLYVADAVSINHADLRSKSPCNLCLCTNSYNAIREIVADLPESTSWIAAKYGSASLLSNELLDWAEGIVLWEQRASLTVAHGGSMQELLDDSTATIGLPIAVCGPLFSDYVFTQTLRADDPFFEELSREGSLSAQSVKRLEKLNVFGSAALDRNVKVFEPNELIRSWHMNRHFHANGKQAFFATAWCLDGKPSPATIELFDKLAQFAYQLYQAAQHEEVGNFARQERALHDLLCGDEPTREEVGETFLKLGLSQEGLWQVAVVQLDDSSSIPQAYHAYTFRNRNERTLSCVVGSEIVALLPAGGTSEATLSELESLADQQHGNLGVSSHMSDLSEVQAAHKQALFAIRMGSYISEERVLERVLGIEKDYPALSFRFDDYLLHELLDHYPLGARGINPGKKPVYELVTYDRANGTQKAKFLYTYMECNGATGETAKHMGIHRNSVGYQVKSIESILGVDLHDLDFLCHARMAFASMEVFGL